MYAFLMYLKGPGAHECLNLRKILMALNYRKIAVHDNESRTRFHVTGLMSSPTCKTSLLRVLMIHSHDVKKKNKHPTQPGERSAVT